MAFTSTSNTAFVEAEVQSRFILTNLPDVDLPESFYRDVTDFPNGTQLNIPTVGARTIQDVSERKEIVPTALTSGQITLTISEEEGDAFYVSDNAREESWDMDALLTQNSVEQTRAIQASRETKFFAACNSAQTASAVNAVNGFDHRWVTNGTSGKIELDDFRKMKAVFSKANNPNFARVAFVDGVVAAQIEASFTASTSVDNNIRFEGVITEGFAKEHKFLYNVFGWDIYETERLPGITSETIAASTLGSTSASPADSVANVFMCIADDNCKPMMHAWRRMPKVRTWRDEPLRSDMFAMSQRYGYGNQRVDSLGVVITSATAL